mmetsp:Transcript_19830/g.33321  ORF Transcript_19830/g.33321 Transcript_19830/m.33321 type:complete len:346 (-) Transcript_19830:121-1158(-)|eukprot:CAMPEP_0198224052 /NCGR_PEP_ID=MMETSP1445-20131203/95186_1 /TAXON_ID=36898 /ORGANISM="Pyramimonas sp., Strain CCMP2087" /LENGTH=345 /DNA_ID=CAMNT_0043903091 /DNA_START=306 /DNA_END=1343 /DNA_ORIENTATION=+
MGGTCSRRSDPYEVKEPPYDYSEIFERVMAEAVSEEAIAACRGRYPQPGTDKWYAIGNEKPISPYESVAVLKEVESGEDCFTVHFTHSGKYITISTMDKVPLAHAVLRRDGISVDIITPGTFPDGKVRVIVGEISCSTADPAPSFSWLTTPQRRLSALAPEDCTTNENDSFCSAAVKLVPNNPSAKEAEPHAPRNAPRLRVASVLHGNENIPFQYVGDVLLINPAQPTGQLGEAAPSVQRVPRSAVDALFAGRMHHAVPIPGQMTRQGHAGLQATIMVKHRRLGDNASPGYVDDHLVLLIQGVAMYNTAVLWHARQFGAHHRPSFLAESPAPSKAKSASCFCLSF